MRVRVLRLLLLRRLFSDRERRVLALGLHRPLLTMVLDVPHRRLYLGVPEDRLKVVNPAAVAQEALREGVTEAVGMHVWHVGPNPQGRQPVLEAGHRKPEYGPALPTYGVGHE